jgi:cytochrome c oxidase subunit II
VLQKMLKFIFPLPPLASEQGARVDFLLYLLHFIILALFIGWSIYFIYVLIRYRSKNSPKADYGGARSKFPEQFELAVAAVEVVLLIGISIPFWGEYTKMPGGSDVIEVEVVAQQYLWNFHYPGQDGKFGRTDMRYYDAQTNPLGLDPGDAAGKDDFTTINEMHLPLNRPCVVTLTTKDVIHSFTIPEMRVKQDAMPGIVSHVWFTPVKKGVYDVACSQLCGIGHYNMRGFLTVEDQADYDAWTKKRESMQ